jgi:hypothetical protein
MNWEIISLSKSIGRKVSEGRGCSESLFGPNAGLARLEFFIFHGMKRAAAAFLEKQGSNAGD